MDRPETSGPPEFFYNCQEAKKYHQNSRIIAVQREMSIRALELLLQGDEDVEERKLILDLGCGSGLSGREVEKMGHFWIGMDISQDMLGIARHHENDLYDDEGSDYDSEEEMEISDLDDYSDDRKVERGDNFGLLLADMGQGVGARPGIFDGAISISALQWLCHSNRRHEDPRRRLLTLFTTLFSCLAPGARAVFQFYPADERQTEMVLGCARKCGFGGGLVVDYSHSPRTRKYYLYLTTSASMLLPQGRMDGNAPSDEEREEVTVADRSRFKAKRRVGKNQKDRDWVLRKKEYRKRKGEDVRPDSKYTARKRRPRF